MRLILKLNVLVCLLALALPAFAQVALIPVPRYQPLDQNGHPYPGGKVYSYVAGTSTPLATYADSGGLFPNTNPVILDAAGSAQIWLTGAAYKITLQDSTGATVYTVDGITSSNLALLSLANTWANTNNFNGAVTFNSGVTFNAGFTSSGPSVLNGGGTMNGTWSGSPTFSGTPNFSGGLMGTTATFSGQIISTVATGTSPFVISSTTAVPNLNASLLLGCTWASPCAIGTMTPNTGAFMTVVIGGGTPLATSNQNGTGNLVLDTAPKFPSYVDFTEIAAPGSPAASSQRAYIDSTSHRLCLKNSSGTATCFPWTQVIRKTSSTCTTGSNSYDACSDTLTWPTSFGDTTYAVNCTGINGSDPRGYWQVSAYTATTVTFKSITGGTNPVNFGEIHCIGTHP